MGKDDFYKISSTALPCAHIRAKYTDIPFSKEMYEELEKERTIGIPIVQFIINYLASHNPSTKTQISVLEGRHFTTNDAIQLDPQPAILEIASGISTRGLEFSARGIPYIETDLPGMIKLKEGLVRRITGDNVSPNHYFKSLNALDTDEFMRTGERIRSVAQNNPITIVQDGLLMYYTPEEKRALRDNIYRFLKEYSPDGTWVTTDLSSRDLAKVRGDFLSKIAMKIISRKAKRKFQRFSSDEEVIQFLNNGNLFGYPLPSKSVSRNLACRKKAKIDKDLIDMVSDRYRAWVVHI